MERAGYCARGTFYMTIKGAFALGGFLNNSSILLSQIYDFKERKSLQALAHHLFGR
ncbi:hypothetical protein BR93DRAFT_548496 [Coniochaeta sp. PMI_546]|nr:hypothetical protein BR93DRAFT_548496 [Coniochaeta sp. PMI_546]